MAIPAAAGLIAPGVSVLLDFILPERVWYALVASSLAKELECHRMIVAERWLSGRKRRSRKPEYGQLYRGFESHSLRQEPSSGPPRQDYRISPTYGVILTQKGTDGPCHPNAITLPCGSGRPACPRWPSLGGASWSRIGGKAGCNGECGRVPRQASLPVFVTSAQNVTETLAPVVRSGQNQFRQSVRFR